MAAPFTPYCPRLSASAVMAMLAEIRQAIEILAEAEGWTDGQRLHVLDVARRQPASTLGDDVMHFRQRLSALRQAKGQR